MKNFKVFEGVTEKKKRTVIKTNTYHTQISGEDSGDVKEDDVEEAVAEKPVETPDGDLDRGPDKASDSVTKVS